VLGSAGGVRGAGECWGALASAVGCARAEGRTEEQRNQAQASLAAMKPQSCRSAGGAGGVDLPRVCARVRV